MNDSDDMALYFAGYLNGLSVRTTPIEFDDGDRELLKAAAVCLLQLSGLDGDEKKEAHRYLGDLRKLEQAEGSSH